jgi:hypothetical protein
MKSLMIAAAALTCAARLSAQDATLIYRLGRDTVAVEQFTRSATKFSGRNGDPQRAGRHANAVRHHSRRR